LDEEGNRGPNFRDLFPTPPPPGLVPSCAEGGVLGVMPGILGSIQANEVIKVISGLGDVLSGRLFLFDAESFETRILKVRKDPNNALNGNNPSITALIDYEEFCGLGNEINTNRQIKSINVYELEKLIVEKVDFQLIDVRETYEYDIVNINGQLIPKDSITQDVDKIEKNKKVVIHCRSGKRSADVIEILETHHGFDNLYNLEGGILEWQFD
jgi:adenylyltransferase/sulfurtransferase